MKDVKEEADGGNTLPPYRPDVSNFVNTDRSTTVSSGINDPTSCTKVQSKDSECVGASKECVRPWRLVFIGVVEEDCDAANVGFSIVF